MLKAQALEDVNWMKSNLPGYIQEPRDLFNFLKKVTTYKHDPKGVELIHSPRSLFEDNFHGLSGAGDCDCFSTLAICGLKAMGTPDGKIKICLTGRNKKTPRHIYLSVNGTPFDLTNSRYGEERTYPYKQEIPLSFF